MLNERPGNKFAQRLSVEIARGSTLSCSFCRGNFELCPPKDKLNATVGR